MKRICVTVTLSLFASLSLMLKAQQPAQAQSSKAYLVGQTAPLANLLESAHPATRKAALELRPPRVRDHFNGLSEINEWNQEALPTGMDPLYGRSRRNSTTAQAEVRFIQEGLDEAASGGVQVPDVNGDKGPNQYIQAVNATELQIFDNDGAELTEPFSANVIWNTIGSEAFSDPVVHYDERADRWFITDLANVNIVLYAVSITPDPLGSYYVYRYQTADFCDYPKYGISDDSYFFSCNEVSSIAQPIYAINRQQLLAGESSIDIQRVSIPGIEGNFPTVTPVDIDGPTDRLGGEIQAVRMVDDAWGNGPEGDHIDLFTIRIDWSDPSNTTFEVQDVFSAPFAASVCGSIMAQNCIPQLGTTVTLDAIHSIVMNRVVYRAFASHESIVLNFTVALGDSRTGIRWMELRRTSDEWVVYQEGTIGENDGLYRWLGAMAINGDGDICIGYAVSSEDSYPGLRFTGRLAGDPLGEMTIEEQELRAGEGARTGSNRYGDYFSMSVDPITSEFWFTGEYVKSDGNWGSILTAIATSLDSIDLSVVDIVSPQRAADLTDEEEVSVRLRNTGLDTIDGYTVGFMLDGDLRDLDTVDMTLAPGDTVVHLFDGALIDVAQVGRVYDVVGFVNTDGDERSYNDTLAASIEHLAAWDASIAFASLSFNSNCFFLGMNVDIQNAGETTIDSLIINVKQADVEFDFFYANAIESGESATVSIPLSSSTSLGDLIVAVVEAINGQDIDEIAANDTLRYEIASNLDFTRCILNLQLDDWPEETSWQVVGADGTIEAQGGPYDPSQEFAVITDSFCLNRDLCYTFRLFDSFGDGLFDPGDYSLTSAAGEELATLMNRNFGDLEENDFCIDSCALRADVTTDPEQSVLGGDGRIMITVSSGVAPFDYSVDGGLAYQSEALFDSLSAGLYEVVVRDGAGCVYTAQVRVEMLTDVDEQQRRQLPWMVSPNPSSDGIFSVLISERIDGDMPAHIDLYDASGRFVRSVLVSPMGQGHQGVISLYDQPGGRYLAILRRPSGDHLMKWLVRL